MSLIYKIAYLKDLCSFVPFCSMYFPSLTNFSSVFTSLLGDGKAWHCDSTKRIKSPIMLWKDSFILSVVPRVNGKRSAKVFAFYTCRPLEAWYQPFCTVTLCSLMIIDYSTVYSSFCVLDIYKIELFREMISESCIYQKSTTFRLKSRHFRCEFTKIRG